MRTSRILLVLISLVGFSSVAVAQSAAGVSSSADTSLSPSFASLVDAAVNAPTERLHQRAYAAMLGQAERYFNELATTAADVNASADARTLAVWVLGERGGADACLRAAQVAGNTEDPVLRLAIATARGRCGDMARLRSLVESGREDPELRARAAATLGVLDDRPSLNAIRALGDSLEEGELRDMTLVARGMLRDASVLEDLKRLLSDRAMHIHAAIGLARLGADYVVFDLQAAALSHESMLRLAAAQLMQQRRMPGACDVLGGLLNDPDTRVAATAAGALDAWENAAWEQWRRDGFAMEHFSEQAYCP